MTNSIQLFGAIAVRPAIQSAIAKFETETDEVVISRWDLNPAVKAQIEAGTYFDVVITNPHFIEQLAALGKVLAGSQVAFGRISMGVAAKAGTLAPRIDTPETFKEALRTAKSIAYASEGSSGAYFSELLEVLGLASDVGPKLVPIAGGGTATSVARGEAELAVVPVTSILAAGPDVVLVGRFPSQLGGHIDFDIALSAAAKIRGSAARLASFLISPDLDQALANAGVDRRA
jgi:molybdate transport system substrate-binding protein